MPKSRRTISVVDVDKIFDTACIRDLAKRSGLPNDVSLARFAENIRQDVRAYARNAREPSDNELHSEIKALYRAADKNRFVQTGELIENISFRARSLLIRRWGEANLGLEFPQPNDFNSIDSREALCAKIASLCRVGGKVASDRMRPSGRRSQTLRVTYYAPGKTRHFLKTAPEIQFIMHLAITWLEATGKPPPKFVHWSKPGPFARMVDECLRRSGACVNSINLINDYGRERAKAELTSEQV